LHDLRHAGGNRMLAAGGVRLGRVSRAPPELLSSGVARERSARSRTSSIARTLFNRSVRDCDDLGRADRQWARGVSFRKHAIVAAAEAIAPGRPVRHLRALA
jgi:hypothetical protein